MTLLPLLPHRTFASSITLLPACGSVVGLFLQWHMTCWPGLAQLFPGFANNWKWLQRSSCSMLSLLRQAIPWHQVDWCFLRRLHCWGTGCRICPNNPFGQNNPWVVPNLGCWDFFLLFCLRSRLQNRGCLQIYLKHPPGPQAIPGTVDGGFGILYSLKGRVGKICGRGFKH